MTPFTPIIHSTTSLNISNTEKLPHCPYSIQLRYGSVATDTVTLSLLIPTAGLYNRIECSFAFLVIEYEKATNGIYLRLLVD
jgi:hypothetical protein